MKAGLVAGGWLRRPVAPRPAAESEREGGQGVGAQQPSANRASESWDTSGATGFGESVPKLQKKKSHRA